MDVITSEFEVINNIQKEMVLFVAMVGTLLIKREESVYPAALSEEECLLVEVLKSLVDRKDLERIREQHENKIKIKNVATALDFGGIQNLLKETPLFGDGFDFNLSPLINDQANVDVQPFDPAPNRKKKHSPGFHTDKSSFEIQKVKAAAGDLDPPGSPDERFEIHRRQRSSSSQQQIRIIDVNQAGRKDRVDK